MKMSREEIIRKMASHIEELSFYDCDEKCPVCDFCDVINTNPRNENNYTCYEVLTRALSHINVLAKTGRSKLV